LNSKADSKRKGITWSSCLNGVSGKVIIDEKGIKDTWKEYLEKLMIEDNELDHRISAGVKKGPAVCIRIDEVAAALKKMKRHKTPGFVRTSRNDTSHSRYWNSLDIGFM